MRKHVRHSKYDPLCEEVELLQTTPTYAHIRSASGREQTVSLRDLAPLPPILHDNNDSGLNLNISSSESPIEDTVNVDNDRSSYVADNTETPVKTPVSDVSDNKGPRRSSRPRKQTDFYKAG